MKEEFEIPVGYKNIQYQFKARLLTPGAYTHKIKVDVNGTEVLFEMDEERNYRAYIDPINAKAIEKADKDLLKEIAIAIEVLVR